MANLLVLVLDDVEHCPSILDAWNKAGVMGITILESTGQARLRRAMRDDLPLMPSLRDLLAGGEMHHRTLFSVVDDDEVVAGEWMMAAVMVEAGNRERRDAGAGLEFARCAG